MSCGLLGANTICMGPRIPPIIGTPHTVAAIAPRRSYVSSALHNFTGSNGICPNTSGKALIWNPTSWIWRSDPLVFIDEGTGDTDCIPIPCTSKLVPPTSRIGTTTPPYYTHSTFTRIPVIRQRSKRKLLCLCRLSIKIL